MKKTAKTPKAKDAELLVAMVGKVLNVSKHRFVAFGGFRKTRLRRSRWMVLHFRRVRRTPQAHVHPGKRIATRTPGDTGRNGQGYRGVELTSTDELHEDQLILWMAQAANKPFVTAAMKKKNFRS